MNTPSHNPPSQSDQAPPPVPATVPIAPTIDPASPPDPRGLGGLLALVDGAERPMPLRRVQVRARIAGDVCRTEIQQTFANPFDAQSGTLLEAVHIFPLPPDGAVTEMRLTAGDLSVRAECRAREAAEQAFAAAREQGQQAGLLTAERADVHTLRVTNLPPGEEVRLEIVVLERLETRDGERRWRFPTVIAPRYLPGEPTGHEGPGVLPDTDRAPDASHLQPPLRLAGGTPLDLEVAIDGPLGSVSSSLHAVRLDLEDGGARVAPSTTATLDRDFVLAIGGRGTLAAAAEPEATLGTDPDAPTAAQPSAHAWTDGAHTLLYVEPPADVDARSLPRDAVFVLDRSGSMSGTKMDAARLALRTALRGLLPGDRFQLLAFDNRLEAFGDGLMDYGDDSLAAAEAWLASVEPRGGTEMRAALRAALEGQTPAGRLRTVLLITDGQVWNQAELLRSVAGRAANTLVFTMGIDTAVNEDLLRRMARLGGGTCELLTPREDIEAAVARLEARFGSPAATGLRIEDEALVPAREGERALFAGAPLSVLLAGTVDEGRLAVHMDTPAGHRAFDVAVRPLSFPLGPLWARERVSALEDRWAIEPKARPAIEAEIRDTALAHGIASRFTAFVAVLETTSAEGERIEIVQPVELPAEWDEGFRDVAAPQARARAARMWREHIGGTPSMVMSDIGVDDAYDMGSVMRLSGGSVSRRGATDGPSAPAEQGSHHTSGHGDRPASEGETEGSHLPARNPAPAPDADPAGELARMQRADGSFHGSVELTAAALLRLIELGHTRKRGLRRRTVVKAARWLREHGGDAAVAREALAALAAAEETSRPSSS